MVDAPPMAAERHSDQEVDPQQGEREGERLSESQPAEGVVSEASSQQEAERDLPPGDRSSEEVPASPATPVSEEPAPPWTTTEDDLSTPTDEEMAEIRLRESRGQELNALDVPSVEKRIYQDVDDPDQRPVKKLRLSWVIKGVRGTREKPNKARVLLSPAAQVDGNYWQIKFYPRGNNSVSLSAYIKCSRHPPKSDGVFPDGSFSFLHGPPDADLRHEVAPTQTEHTEIAPDEAKDDGSSSSDSASDRSKQESIDGEGSTDSSQADKEEPSDVKFTEDAEEDWRVSAQLGMVMYNPQEPRTCHVMSSEHQFAKSNDDWGWTNFVGPWGEVQMRGHLQRAPLLQNDTIAIDAYIGIFDDPTQALWWHSSDAEGHWDSKTLTGYFPMGTPPLYHSPAVAGMTAWLLLAPFRKIMQEVDAKEWRRNPLVPSTPLICQLQMILFLMRHLRKDRETYVDLYPAVSTIKESGETYHDVKTFWEVFRRSIELELEGKNDSLDALRAIFDTPDGPLSLRPLPVEGVDSIQQGLTEVLRDKSFKGQLPDFLPLSLARERLGDPVTREWRLLYDRVMLNEELNLSEFVHTSEHAKYTLYGFMVHVGERKSGRFYTVLRPGGPGTKWLAFEDGDGNKVFSYTKKRIQSFEGLEGQALKDFTSTRETAYMAMYIKTSRLGEYLVSNLEPYKLPTSLLPHLESQFLGGEFLDDSLPKDTEQITVELYSDTCLWAGLGLFDMSQRRRYAHENGYFCSMSVPIDATYQEVRQQLAQKLAQELEITDVKPITNVKQLRLFSLRFGGLGNHLPSCLRSVDMGSRLKDTRTLDQPVYLLFSTLHEEDVALFGIPDCALPEEAATDGQQSQPQQSQPQQEDVTSDQVSAVDAEQVSIQAAVAADITRIPAGSEQPSSQLTDMQDPETFMQLEIPPPTVEESLVASVPHGHLINAAGHNGSEAMEITIDNDDTQEASAGSGSTLSSLEQGIIADVIAQAAESGEPLVDVSTSYATIPAPESAEASNESPEPAQAGQAPIDHVYGRIQDFDMEMQNFVTQKTFFAISDQKIVDFVRRHMGRDPEQCSVFIRESATEGSVVGPDDTFKSRDFPNGCDLIIGPKITEVDTKELQKEGKFSDPFELSRYLRMVARRHPIQALTTSEPIEITDFGTGYYKGPLVKGLKHGDDCVWISSAADCYRGPLVFNKKCGKGGKMIYRNGDTYEGDWDDDQRHGHGTFVERRTGNRYVGGFEYGKRWGMGTTYWQVADEQADLCQICCEQDVDALFFDCGHVCSCVECAKQCEICPICRRTVKQVVKMFRA